MKIKYFAAVGTALAFFMFAFVPVAFAHEHDVFQIGNQQYTFTVGSLNEPVVVDDKTGVDLTVTSGGGSPTMSADGDMDGPAAASQPVTGLEKTLKVEISAGSQKKTFDLTPDYGKAGGYAATFYPTVQTTYAYRFFGTINNLPVDLTFTCNPAPSSVQAEDDSKVQISDQVSRISKAGAFGCPLAKADLGFPESSIAQADLNAKVDALSNTSAPLSKNLSVVAIILGALGVILGGYAVIKK